MLPAAIADLEEKKKIALLAAAGKSNRQIGREIGRAANTVKKHLQVPEVIADVQDMQLVLADRFEQTSLRALDFITDEKLDKSSARDLGILAGVCLDKSRVITGQSTQNVAVLIANAVIESDE